MNLRNAAAVGLGLLALDADAGELGGAPFQEVVTGSLRVHPDSDNDAVVYLSVTEIAPQFRAELVRWAKEGNTLNIVNGGSLEFRLGCLKGAQIVRDDSDQILPYSSFSGATPNHPVTVRLNFNAPDRAYSDGSCVSMADSVTVGGFSTDTAK